MKDVEDEFAAAGARVIWVLNENISFQLATSQDAQNYYRDTIASALGVAVGDAETSPDVGAFNDTPIITSGRGFVMVVRRSDMQVTYSVNYSSSSAAALLAEVQAAAP